MFELSVDIKTIKFRSLCDEYVFFNWLGSIKSINKVVVVDRNINLRFTSVKISDISLRECIAIFLRYKLDMSILSAFLNEQNKHWFFENKQAAWHKKVFKIL